jgi:hypothetical protein
MRAIENSFIINAFIDHWFDVAFIVLAVIVLWLLLKFIVNNDKSKVTKILVGLVVEAEKFLGTSTGQIKKKQVISWFYTRYPVLAMFIDEEKLSTLIDTVVYNINYYLIAEDANLLSLSEEQDKG